MAGKYGSETTTDKFIGRLGTSLTDGDGSLSVAFGLRTGLFKILIDLHPTPKTSQEIADAGGFKERYVREWLGAMVCASIVDIDQASEKYLLPHHRVPAFKEEDMRNLIASWCKGDSMLSEGFDAMLETIKKEGPLGVPFSKYKLFHECIADCSITWFNDHLCQTFVPSIPALKEGLETGIRVLDIGCGRGGAARNFAIHFPNSSVVGLDISKDDIECANEAAMSKNLTNVEYVCADATAMPADWTNTFDYAFTFDVVHDIPRPDLLLAEIGRVLKPGGMYSCFEPNLHSRQVDNIDLPHAVTYYTISLFYCLPVSCQFPGSLALGACWGKEDAVKLLQKNGFAVQATHDHLMGGGGDTLHYWCILNQH